MTLDKNSLFKPKRTGTIFRFEDIDGAFQETGFYDLDYSDIGLLIKTIRENYIDETNDKILSDFHYLSYIQNKTVYNPIKGTAAKKDRTFVSPENIGVNKGQGFYSKPKVFLELNMDYPNGAEVDLRPILKVKFDFDRSSFFFVIEYFYSIDFIKGEMQSNIFSTKVFEKGLVAFRFLTTNLFAAKSLCYDLTVGAFKDAEYTYVKKTLAVYKKIDPVDSESKKVFYTHVPPFILKYIGKNQLVKDLTQLLNYDIDSNFIDTSGVLINILKGFKDGQFLYNYLHDNRTLVLDIYKYINSTSKREELCQFLTALAFCYEPKKLPSKYFNVKNGGRYVFDSNTTVYRDSKIRLKYGYYTKRTGGSLKDGGGAISKYVPVANQLFNPLDIVTLEDSFSGQKTYATAISIKLLTDIKEWKAIINFIVITVNIISIFVAVGIVLKGAVGLVRFLAISDIIISTIDIALLNEELKEKIRYSGDPGVWFIENWTKISMFTSLSVMSLHFAEGLIKNADELKRIFGEKELNNPELLDRVKLLEKLAIEAGQSGGDITKSFFKNAKIAIKEEKALGAIFGQMNNHTCVASSLKMVLNDLKIIKFEDDLARALNTTSKGANILDIPNALPNAYIDNLKTIARGAKLDKNVKFSTLQKQMKQGDRKAIVSVRTEEFGAHALVVDKIENGRVFVRDPLPIFSGSSYSVDIDDFRRIFNKKFVTIKK